MQTYHDPDDDRTVLELLADHRWVVWVLFTLAVFAVLVVHAKATA